MLLLAIETCLGSLSVALVRSGDGGLLARAEEPAGSAHAELLVPAVGRVLREAGCALRDVSRIAITLGPGSFTGVRTGIAAARGFRLGTSIEIVGVGSLVLLAAMARREHRDDRRPVLAVMDARRGRVYAQLFGAPDLDPLSEPQEMAPDEAYRLATLHGEALVTGSGASLIANGAAGASDLLILPLPNGSAAEALARLAPALAPLRDISPIYIRPPDAKPSAGPLIARFS